MVNFKVRAPKDAHVVLPTGPTENSPMYEVRFIIAFFFWSLNDCFALVHILKLLSLPV